MGRGTPFSKRRRDPENIILLQPNENEPAKNSNVSYIAGPP
jgi:hypothetical protein